MRPSDVGCVSQAVKKMLGACIEARAVFPIPHITYKLVWIWHKICIFFRENVSINHRDTSEICF